MSLSFTSGNPHLQPVHHTSAGLSPQTAAILLTLKQNKICIIHVAGALQGLIKLCTATHKTASYEMSPCSARWVVLALMWWRRRKESNCSALKFHIQQLKDDRSASLYGGLNTTNKSNSLLSEMMKKTSQLELCWVCSACFRCFSSSNTPESLKTTYLSEQMWWSRKETHHFKFFLM